MNNQNNNFFSMDRLVEFGMGMAMSQQIVKSMNDMMSQMNVPPQIQVSRQGFSQNSTIGVQGAVPGVGVVPGIPVNGMAMATPVTQPIAPQIPQQQAQTPPPLPQIPDVYYIAEGGKQEGPYNGTEIARLVMEKKVTAKTYVWKPGMQGWKTAADFPDLVALIALVPPELPKTPMEEK